MENKEIETSKELQAIVNAIEKYCEKHKNKVQFYGSFMAFKGKIFACSKCGYQKKL